MTQSAISSCACRAGCALRHVKTPEGKPLVQGKTVTGFANTEEEAVGLTKVVPFLVEDELKAKGGIFSKAADWQPYVLTDGLLMTGQNPASSGPGARALVEVMNRRLRSSDKCESNSCKIKGGSNAACT
jgi:putative intracellular protease/amidase